MFSRNMWMSLGVLLVVASVQMASATDDKRFDSMDKKDFDKKEFDEKRETTEDRREMTPEDDDDVKRWEATKRETMMKKLVEREIEREMEREQMERDMPEHTMTTRGTDETKRSKRWWGLGYGYGLGLGYGGWGGYGYGWPYYGGWWGKKRDTENMKKELIEREIEREELEKKEMLERREEMPITRENMPIEHHMSRRSIPDMTKRNKRWWGLGYGYGLGLGYGGWGGYGYGWPYYGGWWGKKRSAPVSRRFDNY